jgi:hypothetical protein
MEELKSFEELLLPDSRWEFFAFRNHITNKVNKYELSDLYKNAESINLSENVPDDIKSQFNVARMLCVYTWLYYPFHQIAELKAFSTVEMALKNKFNKPRSSLKSLIQHAVNKGLIKDINFSHSVVKNSNYTENSVKLPEIVSELRNDLAHGSTTLRPGSMTTLRNCAEIINQIYP